MSIARQRSLESMKKIHRIAELFGAYFSPKKYLIDPKQLKEMQPQEASSKLLQALISSQEDSETPKTYQDRCLSELARIEEAFPSLSMSTLLAKTAFIQHLKKLGKFCPSPSDIDFRATHIAQLMIGKSLYDYQVRGVWSDIPLGKTLSISLSECLSNPTFAIFRLGEFLREDPQLAVYWEVHGRPPKSLEKHEEFHLGFATAIHQHGFDNFLSDLLKGISYRTNRESAQLQ